MAPSSSIPHRSSLFSWGIALATISLLTIGGGKLIWSQRNAPPATTPLNSVANKPQMVSIGVALPPHPVAKYDATLHTITYGVENGTAIVKIRVLAHGDELIVDARTGRLLETRPSMPTAPPPMGKFAAPFAPMM